MGQLQSNGFDAQFPNSSATILYIKIPRTRDQIAYNAEARRILSPAESHLSIRGSSSSQNLPALCNTWSKSLEKKLASSAEFDQQKDLKPTFMDLYQSGRRQYGVKAFILSNHSSGPSKDQRQTRHYLFILERIHAHYPNIPMIARQWRLNRREQEIARLLLSDQSNKEMADTLKLSLNTIKMYMKFLMRRLDVSSRAGIVARLLTGESLSGIEPSTDKITLKSPFDLTEN